MRLQPTDSSDALSRATTHAARLHSPLHAGDASQAPTFSPTTTAAATRRPKTPPRGHIPFPVHHPPHSHGSGSATRGGGADGPVVPGLALAAAPRPEGGVPAARPLTSREKRIASLRRPHTAFIVRRHADAEAGGASNLTSSNSSSSVSVHNHDLALRLLGISPRGASSEPQEAKGAGPDILVVHGSDPDGVNDVGGAFQQEEEEEEEEEDDDEQGGMGATRVVPTWQTWRPTTASSPRIGSGIGLPPKQQINMLRPRTASSVRPSQRHGGATTTATSGSTPFHFSSHPRRSAMIPPRPPTAGPRRSRVVGVAPPLPPSRALPPRLHSPLTDSVGGSVGRGGKQAALLGIMQAESTQASASLLVCAEKGDVVAVGRLLEGGLCDVNERSGLVRCRRRLRAWVCVWVWVCVCVCVWASGRWDRKMKCCVVFCVLDGAPTSHVGGGGVVVFHRTATHRSTTLAIAVTQKSSKGCYSRVLTLHCFQT